MNSAVDDDSLDDIIIVGGDVGDGQDQEKLKHARETIRRHLRRVKRRMDDDKRTKCVHALRRVWAQRLLDSSSGGGNKQ